MTPAARAQAAIEAIDRIAAGASAEQVLTNWARGARYAGSKDRAAVRDLVFEVVRRWRSTAALGGGEGGRARMLGLLRQQDADPAEIFTGLGHAPAELSPEELARGDMPTGAAAQDLPDWLWARFETSLGEGAVDVAQVLRTRAPVGLRVNTLKASRAQAQAALAEAGIDTRTTDLSPTALLVTKGARAVARSPAYTDGLVELQDAASQAITDELPLKPGMSVLDYCAGGGGKALAMAARLGGGPVVAHDANPARMADLAPRAARAGARVEISERPKGRFDLVLCDVPCSGSGAWRRAPEGKWRLGESDLEALQATQSKILDTCARVVAVGGRLAYATCSVLNEENGDRVAAFLAGTPGWHLESARQYLPGDDGDGLYVAILARGG